MLRRPFTLLSAVSLVLCAATCVLWARSYWVGDGLLRTAAKRPPPAGYHEHSLYSSRGLLVWRWHDVSESPADRAFGIEYTADAEEPWQYIGPMPPQEFYEDEDRLLGVRVGWYASHPRLTGFRTVRVPVEDHCRTHRSVWVPHGQLAAACAVLPLAAGVRWRRAVRRAARRRAGQCFACGYDLRAGPDPGGDLLARCPECGTEPPGTTGPAARLAEARLRPRRAAVITAVATTLLAVVVAVAATGAVRAFLRTPSDRKADRVLPLPGADPLAEDEAVALAGRVLALVGRDAAKLHLQPTEEEGGEADEPLFPDGAVTGEPGTVGRTRPVVSYQGSEDWSAYLTYREAGTGERWYVVLEREQDRVIGYSFRGE